MHCMLVLSSVQLSDQHQNKYKYGSPMEYMMLQPHCDSEELASSGGCTVV
jgi:hypothetical protein